MMAVIDRKRNTNTTNPFSSVVQVLRLHQIEIACSCFEIELSVFFSWPQIMSGLLGSYLNSIIRRFESSLTFLGFLFSPMPKNLKKVSE